MTGEAAALETHAPEIQEMIVLAVRGAVLFPGTVMPLTVGRTRSVGAVKEAVRRDAPLGVVLQRDEAQDEPGPLDLHRVGTAARVLRLVTAPDGTHQIICQGERRIRVHGYVQETPHFVARVQPVKEPADAGPEIEGRVAHLRDLAVEALRLLPETPRDLIEAARTVEPAGVLADMIAGYMDLEAGQKQDVLETVDLVRRLDKVTGLLIHRIEVLRVTRRVSEQARESIGERQRRHILTEQLRAIRRELGDQEDEEDLAELRHAIDGAGMPEEIHRQADKELRRLGRMPDGSMEAGMVRTWLDWLAALPWSRDGDAHIDVGEARRQLDEDHHGLGKVKRRILEFLAVRKLAPAGKSPILCFVGPPGVGKTSLGQSIAKATGRAFARVSLGGVHDEAEIRGHRRTYVGALPGTIIQAIRKAGVRNPVMMLDEIDKMGGGGLHGDPAAAMLEVLDPEQNATFRDNYLGVPFDLSRVLFIATANVLEAVPGPLRDRMEVIDLPGYTEDEKVSIAARYLLPRQRDAHGLGEDKVAVDEAALHAVVRDYTREAGVRNLEREIAGIMRHAAIRVAEGEAGPIRVTAAELPAVLGPRRFENETAMRTAMPGVATGLAWTPAGGDILFIEATRMPGGGRLILTGQLGEVMRESAQAALSLVKSRALSIGIDPKLFETSDIHVHVPAGAIPKDGPSAGVAMFTALVSLLTDRCIRSDTAMTGEVSLRGLVLPVGGIKEKVTAAARAGIGTVLLPRRNEKDVGDIPAAARKDVRIRFVDTVDDAVEEAIGPR